MIVMGVTGGIGMGKSAAGEILEKLGVGTIDTDALARDVSCEGTPAYHEIVNRFGAETVIGSDGEIDRRRLAKLVFGDLTARLALEAILHPRIRAGWKLWLEQQKETSRRVSAVLIPLLFEKGYQSEFDIVVGVGCSRKTQHDRLLIRGWDEAQIGARNAAQMPAEEKLRLAQFVVWTEGPLTTHACQWRVILQRLGLTYSPV